MNDQADDLQARARARIGQVLAEKWRVDKLIGVGGMAAVYAVTHVNNGRRAAVKLLHTELGTSPDIRTRFLREGYVANKVDHPGTVQVLDDQVTADGVVFLVMDLLEGESLEDRRERGGTLPAHVVLSLADRLLDVLAAAHDKGIIHRDIKPENIFLTRDGSVKVLDFGIARMRELSAARMTLTSAGAIGTPAFMPPEQARGRWDDVGPKSDLWAVGATMFTLVTGRLVHQAETLNELMLAAMTRPAPPIESVAPGTPPALAAVIDRALAFDIAARWPDARAMQAAVRTAYAGAASGDRPSLPSASGLQPAVGASPMGARGGPTAHPVTVVGEPATARPRLPVLPIAGGLLGAVLTGGLVLVLVSRQLPPTGPAAASGSATAAEAAPAQGAEGAGTATSAAGVTPPPGAASVPTAGASGAASAPSASSSASADASKAKPPVVFKPRPGAAWPRPKH
jgi:serine/threonine-protein kinase